MPKLGGGYLISIHAPHTGRDLGITPKGTDSLISIHAPHTGRDTLWLHNGSQVDQFQSTRPIRGATCLFATRWIGGIYFNPRAPYGARQEGDTNITFALGISIHAPHTGRDLPGLPPCQRLYRFQSTRPIRGATTTRNFRIFGPLNFNPRAPYGARLQPRLDFLGHTDFNPRAPYGARQQKCIIYVLHFCNNRQSKHKNQQETSSVRTFF